MMKYFSPGLNTNKTTTFTFFNWIKGYSDTMHSNQFIGTIDSLDLIITDHKGFDFTIYNALFNHRNKVPMNQDWLEWLVGFCDQ